MALLAASITGPSGAVVGIDLDERVLEIAQERAVGKGYRHVNFERADALEYRPDRLFDAVVARHVQIHTVDPLSIIRRAFSLLRPGGLAVFQEYDLSYWPTRHPEVPLAAGLQGAMVELFRKATPHANIGMLLPDLIAEAGFRNPQSSAECLVDCGPDSLFFEWFAETIRSVLPALKRFGLAAIVGDVDTLEQRLRDEMVAAQACITSPLIAGAFGIKV